MRGLVVVYIAHRYSQGPTHRVLYLNQPVPAPQLIAGNIAQATPSGVNAEWERGKAAAGQGEVD